MREPWYVCFHRPRRDTPEDTGPLPDLQAAHQLSGLRGAVEVGDAAYGARETGYALALKGLADALAELLRRRHNVMIAPRAGPAG